MTGRNWVWVRGKAPSVMPKSEKQKTRVCCEEFIAASLVPRIVKGCNPNIKQQQCVGISLKVYKNFFRLSARINDTRDEVTENEYEIPFARVEYCGEDRFSCSYLRYNGEWVDFTFGQPAPLSDCFKLIVEQPHFMVMDMFGS